MKTCVLKKEQELNKLFKIFPQPEKKKKRKKEDKTKFKKTYCILRNQQMH